MAVSEGVEIVNFHVTAVGQIPKPRFQDSVTPQQTHLPAPLEIRTAYFGPAGTTDVQVFRRSSLTPGAMIGGARHHRGKNFDRRDLPEPASAHRRVSEPRDRVEAARFYEMESSLLLGSHPRLRRPVIRSNREFQALPQRNSCRCGDVTGRSDLRDCYISILGFPSSMS